MKWTVVYTGLSIEGMHDLVAFLAALHYAVAMDIHQPRHSDVELWSLRKGTGGEPPVTCRGGIVLSSEMVS